MMTMRVTGVILLLTTACLCDDLYKLLDVTKDASNRDIRKAFKKLALKYHPDKNNEDNAHEKFLKINRAYEILKDEESRKKYDLYGDEDDGDNKSYRKQQYQSWSYYNDDFGIYDDDKEIVTLDSGDFRRSVLESSNIWFINFYSPRCSHCHDLAPIWRRLAVLLEGVVRIGAVNCQEEFMLCRQQGITGYPSLKLFTLQQGTVKFQGRKEEEEILNFVVSFLPDKIVDLWEGNLNKWSQSDRSSSWLVTFCQDSCMSHSDKRLLGAMLDGLTNLASVDCALDSDICDKLRGKHDDAQLLFFPNGLEDPEPRVMESSVHDVKDITAEVLKLLPEVTKITSKESFDEMRKRLDNEVGPSWLIHFVNGDIGDGLHYKKIAAFIPRQRLGKVDCDVLAEVCRDLFITKFPSFALFKLGGGWELHYGKDNIEDVVQFTRLASQARTMETFVSSDFPDIVSFGAPVIIDFFAPWCPPCMNFLPEFRKASTLIGGQVSFGTVDCTLHAAGNHNPQDVADFVLDVLRPTVVILDEENFEKTVGSKSEDEMWLVDFYAPWCGPCQQLAPEWRKLAKMLDRIPDVHVGQVDCEANSNLCYKFGIRGYPTIRMYPLDSRGVNKYHPYNQYHRDVSSLHSWVQTYLPSNVENITPYGFEHKVLGQNSPWLVLFMAPWCHHCTRFEPQYEDVARILRGEVSVGKINCEKFSKMCNKASVRGYPTLRYYRGRGEAELYTSKDIKERDVDKIVMIVKQLMKQHDEEVKPVVDDINRPTQDEDIQNDDVHYDDDIEEEGENFVYFYDDEEGAFHDEL